MQKVKVQAKEKGVEEGNEGRGRIQKMEEAEQDDEVGEIEQKAMKKGRRTRFNKRIRNGGNMERKRKGDGNKGKVEEGEGKEREENE